MMTIVTATGSPLTREGFELPLTYGVECGLIKHGDRLEHARVVDSAVRPDRGLDEHVAVRPRRHGGRRIDGPQRP
jgi:hypothetical protein